MLANFYLYFFLKRVAVDPDRRKPLSWGEKRQCYSKLSLISLLKVCSLQCILTGKVFFWFSDPFLEIWVSSFRAVMNYPCIHEPCKGAWTLQGTMHLLPFSTIFNVFSFFPLPQSTIPHLFPLLVHSPFSWSPSPSLQSWGEFRELEASLPVDNAAWCPSEENLGGKSPSCALGVKCSQ